MDEQRQVVATTMASRYVGRSPDHEGLAPLRVVRRSAKTPPTYRHLVAAAQRTFERRGYNDTRVADIARSARMTPATFYRYFASKETVFDILVQQAADVALTRIRSVPEAADPLQRMVDLVRAYVWQFQQNAWLFDADQQRSQGATPVSAVRAEARECFIDLIHTEIIRERTMSEPTRRWADHMTAEVLGAMVDQMCHLRFVLGGEYDDHTMMRALESACVRAVGKESSGAQAV